MRSNRLFNSMNDVVLAANKRHGLAQKIKKVS